MIKVKVEPGSCGNETLVRLITSDRMNIRVELISQCPHIDNMYREIQQIDAYQECFTGPEESKILAIGRRHCAHSGCPVPMSIIKGIEAAVGVSQPEDIRVKIEKE